MGLIVFDNSVDVAQTHVLIIGVGHLRYVTEAKENPEFEYNAFSSLPEATSPIHSALGFYTSVVRINESRSWVAPLGSVELMLSIPDENVSAFHNFEFTDPTRLNLENAYNGWKRRCSTHKDNVAIFYYCGHGFSTDDDFLVASDFLKNPSLPHAHAFNLQKTVRGFQSCQSQKKLFFIDACRTVNPDLLLSEFNPLGLDSARYYGKPQHCFVQQAAGPGMPAFGQKHSISNYTTALIRALEGQACTENRGEGWEIKTGAIGCAVNQMLREANDPSSHLHAGQFCTQEYMQSFAIVNYKEPPKVKVEVETHPYDDRSNTVLRCSRADTNDLLFHCEPQAAIWSFVAPAGIYSIAGETVTKPTRFGRQVISFIPPITKTQLHLRDEQ